MFHDFLIAGIESLKQANIVKPQPKAVRRKTFLGLRKGPHLPSFKEPQKAEVYTNFMDCITYSTTNSIPLRAYNSC